MRIIYLDDKFMCHVNYKDGYKEVQTDALDNVCDEALRFYKFIPAGTEIAKNTTTCDFVQCVDSKSADLVEAIVTKNNYEQMYDELAEVINNG